MIVLDLYCEIPLGLFLLRGDNIVIFGEVDDGQLEATGVTLKMVSQAEIMERKKEKEKATGGKVDWDLE